MKMTFRNYYFIVPFKISGNFICSIFFMCMFQITLGQSAYVPGKIAVLVIGDGIAPLSSSAAPLFIKEFNLAGASQTGTVRTTFPTTATSGTGSIARALTQSGSSTSEGLISLSSNGQYLVLTGYNTTSGTANVSSSTATTFPTNTRVVGRVDATGTANTSTTFNTGYSGAAVRAAASVDGSAYWSAGANAIYYVTNGNVAAPITLSATNTRGIGISSGQLYTSTQSGSLRLATVGTGLPTSGTPTVTNLSGMLTTTGDPYGFTFIDVNSGGPDILYFASLGTAPTGLLKYTSSDNGATWTARGSLTGNVFGVTGLYNPCNGNVDLYITANSVNAKPNSLYKFTDASVSVAAPANISSSGSALSAVGTLLATAATNTAFGGVAFTPGTNVNATEICGNGIDDDCDGSIDENNALNFDGIDDNVSLGTTLGNFGSSDFTVEFWAKTSSSNDHDFMGKRVACGGGTFWNIRQASGKVFAEVYGSSALSLTSTTSVNNGSWHHIALTRTGTTLRLYIDGNLEATTLGTVTTLTNAATLMLGLSACNVKYTGSLDEVRLWTVARSQVQLQSAMSSDVIPQTGLIAYYKFDQGTANVTNSGITTLTDISGNSNTGTLNTFALTGTTSNWVGGYNTSTWYKDADNDLYSDGTSTITCAQLTGYYLASHFAALTGDCNDNDAAVYPGSSLTINCGANINANLSSCGTTTTVADPTVHANCTANGALDFDGTNDYVQTTEFNLSTAPFTLELWIKPNANNAAHLISNRTSESSGIGTWFALERAATGKITVEIAGPAAGNYDVITGNATVAIGAWTHVALVRSGSQITVYINGVSDIVYNGSFTRNFTTANNIIRLGGNVNFNALWYNGSMDEVRIWNTARTQLQLQSNMNLKMTGLETGMIRYYDLNETSGTTAKDNSTTAANGTLNGFALTGSTSNWVAGQTSIPNYGIINNFNNTTSATGIYPSGTTNVLWTTKTNNQTATCTQVITLVNPTPTVNATRTICANDTLHATTTLTGGSWSSSNGNATVDSNGIVTGVSAGTAAITYAKTVNGCTNSEVTNVTLNASPQPYISPGNSNICSGDEIYLHVADNGLFTGGYPVGTTVDWTGIVNGLSPQDSVSSNNGSSYTATVHLPNGCSATSATVIISTHFVFVSADVTNATCENPNGKIKATVIGTAPFHYIYRNALNVILRDTVSNTATDSLMGLNAGSYNVSVTNSIGCSTNTGVSISTTTAPHPVITPGNTELCSGEQIYLHVIDSGVYASGYPVGTTVDWPGIVNGLTAEDSISSINGFSFTATVHLPNGCVATSPTVTVNTHFVGLTADVTNSTCENPNGKIKVTVTGTAPFHYIYSDGITIIRDFHSAQSVDSITDVAAGSYTITVIDNDGSVMPGPSCTAEQYVTLNNSLLPTYSTTSVTICSNDFPYQWNGLTLTDTGTYVATLNNANVNGCDSITTLVLTAEYIATPVVTLSGPDTLCAPSTALLSFVTSPDVIYQWKKDGIPLSGENNDTLYATSSGSYDVQAKNEFTFTNNTPFPFQLNDCISSPVTVSYSAGNISSTTISVSLTISNPDNDILTVYLQAPNGQRLVLIEDFESGFPGDYNSATFSDLATIFTYDDIEPFHGNYKSMGYFSSFSSAQCMRHLISLPSFSEFGGGSINPNGQWQLKFSSLNGEATLDSWTLHFLSNCISYSNSVSVVVHPLPQITVTGNTRFCNGDSAILDAGIHASYLWNTGATTQSITVKTAGYYYVSVPDSNGCSGISDSINVIVDEPLIATITANGPTTFCQGGSVTLSATSNGEYHRWYKNGNLISYDIYPSLVIQDPGSYTITSFLYGYTCGSTNSNPVIITVNPPTVTTTFVEICEVDSPYIWHGNTYTESGIYPDTIQSGNIYGCDSINILYLQFIDVPATVTAISSTSFCSGDSVILTAPPQVNSGNAIKFDGVNDYAQSTYSPGTSDFTLEAWIKPGGNNNAYLFSTRTNEGDANGNWLALQRRADGKISVEITNGNYDVVMGNTITPVNGWTHVAMVRSGTTITLYVNGIADAVYNGAFVRDFTTGNNSFQLGGWPSSNTAWFNGSMEEVRMWNIARTNNEIQYGMYYSIAVLSPGLKIYYKMDETGNTLIDSSPNGINGTLNNGPVHFASTLQLLNSSLSYQWNTGATSQSITSYTSGSYIVTVTNSNGCSAVSDTIVVTDTCAVAGASLDLRFFIEGFYLGGETMQTVLANSGYSISNSVVDSVIIELHDQFNPEILISSDQVILNVDGWVHVDYPSNIAGGTYYIAIRTRNAIETWSKIPVIINANTVFDFTR